MHVTARWKGCKCVEGCLYTEKRNNRKLLTRRDVLRTGPNLPLCWARMGHFVRENVF